METESRGQIWLEENIDDFSRKLNWFITPRTENEGKEKRGSLVSHVLCCGEVRALWCFKGSSRSRFRSDSFVLSHTLMSRWSTEQLSRQTTDLEISWWTNNICSPVRWVNEKKKLKKSKFWKKIPSVYFRMWIKKKGMWKLKFGNWIKTKNECVCN